MKCRHKEMSTVENVDRLNGREWKRRRSEWSIEQTSTVEKVDRSIVDSNYSDKLEWWFIFIFDCITEILIRVIERKNGDQQREKK